MGSAAAWSLAFLLQGLWVLTVVAPDAMTGKRVPVVTGLVIAVHMPLVWNERKRGGRATPSLAYVSLFGCLQVLALTFNGIGEYGVWKLGVFICLSWVPAYLLYRFYGQRERRLRTFLIAMAVFGVGPVLLLVREMLEYGLPAFRYVMLTRGDDLIGMSRSIGVAAVIIVGLSIEEKASIAKAAGLSVVGVLVAVQILTGERGPVIATIVALTYLLVRGRRTDKGRFRAVNRLVRVGVLVTCLGVAIPSAHLSERLTVAALKSDQRLEILRFAIDTWRPGHLFLGRGLGRFDYYGDESQKVRQFPHNIFVEVFVEIGVVALLVLGAYLLAVSRTGLGREAWQNADMQGLELATRALFLFALVVVQVSGDLATNSILWIAGTIVAIAAAPRRGGASAGRGCVKKATAVAKR